MATRMELLMRVLNNIISVSMLLESGTIDLVDEKRCADWNTNDDAVVVVGGVPSWKE